MKKWSNTIKRYIARPCKIVKVKTLSDVIGAVQEAESKNIPIRAVGSGHSFSDVAIVPDGGILLDFRKVNQFNLQSKTSIKSSFHLNNLVNVGAGITIKELNKKLDKVKLGIVNMGGIDHQTISGVISTGTHGTGIKLPAMSGMVKSIVLVAAAGKVYRIEPEDGITDPISNDEKGITLIQNDNVFNSVLVSMGCMGIIYSLILEVNDLYWLMETKTLCNWDEVRSLILNKKIHEEKALRSVMININPYKVNNRRKCTVVKHYEISEPETRNINEATRNWFPSLVNNSLVFAYLMWRMNRRPENIPKKIDSALRNQKDKVFINRGHKVLFQGIEYLKERAYDCEFAFDLKETAYLNALDDIFKSAEDFRGLGFYQPTPIGMRFVKRSPAFLTPEYERDVCYLDTAFFLKSKGADIILDEYQEIMLKYGGIPHWGKINSILDKQPEILEQLYPKIGLWRENLERFNPYRLFSNNFSHRLMLDISTKKTVKI